MELRVGGLEETLTVSGQAAVVDVRTAARTAVLSRDVLDALPTSRTYTTAGAIIPGIRLTKPDIGGTQAVQQAYPGRTRDAEPRRQHDAGRRHAGED